MTDLDRLWLATLQEVASRAAHELKDALNGVHLNLEAIRSRSARAGTTAADVAGFAESAASQLESVTARSEALLFLARPDRGKGPVDVAQTLKHLSALLVPAAKSDGGSLTVSGHDISTATAAPATAMRLAVAAGLLALIKEGGSGQCRLEAPSAKGPKTDGGAVVRFSHESAGALSLDPAIANAVAEHHIRTSRSGSDLLLEFPGT